MPDDAVTGLPTIKLEDVEKSAPPVKEEKFFELTDAEALDLSVRRWVARGALIVALVLYVLGILAVLAQFGVINVGSVTRPIDWRHFVTTIVALFTVPTILTVTVLRSTNKAGSDKSSDSPQESALNRAISLVESLVERQQTPS